MGLITSARDKLQLEETVHKQIINRKSKHYCTRIDELDCGDSPNLPNVYFRVLKS